MGQVWVLVVLAVATCSVFAAETATAPKPAASVEWNIERIHAPEAWAIGDGTGAKIGFIGTGVRGTHEALRDGYVGAAGYGWRDPYSNTQEPNDKNGSGTHTMAIAAGKHGVGVAPGAQWMACKGLKDDGTADQAQFLTCAQFMTCPTDASGNNPICSRAPQVVLVQLPKGAGTTGNWFDAAMQVWASAGIVAVIADGDTGPACSTATYPGSSAHVIGVGFTTRTNSSVAPSSSRGPVIGTSRVKPDLVAPGESIRSASAESDSSYMVLSGSSASAAHVAGVLALMFGVSPNLTVEAARTLAHNTASKPPSNGTNCGGINESIFPNNASGWGLIDALQAVQAAR